MDWHTIITWAVSGLIIIGLGDLYRWSRTRHKTQPVVKPGGTLTVETPYGTEKFDVVGITLTRSIEEPSVLRLTLVEHHSNQLQERQLDGPT